MGGTHHFRVGLRVCLFQLSPQWPISARSHPTLSVTHIVGAQWDLEQLSQAVRFKLAVWGDPNQRQNRTHHWQLMTQTSLFLTFTSRSEPWKMQGKWLLLTLAPERTTGWDSPQVFCSSYRALSICFLFLAEIYYIYCCHFKFSMSKT